MSVQRGAEWNFAYVLPPAPGQEPRDVDLVVPSAVQMGWTESPGFFCAASETARDVADDRCAEPVGSLPPHPLEDWMLPPDKWASQERGSTPGGFVHMLEVYVDDFCALAQSTNAVELRHISQALLHSVHDVFPPPEISGLGGEPGPADGGGGGGGRRGRGGGERGNRESRGRATTQKAGRLGPRAQRGCPDLDCLFPPLEEIDQWI